MGYGVGMKKLLPAIIAVLLLIPVPVQAAKRVALVIGNSAYKASPLKNPANDATDMAAALKKLGFEVILKEDACKRDMLSAMEDFAVKLRQAEAGLFYYAGHGMQIGGQNYLIPVGAYVSSEIDVEYEGLVAGRILRNMENAGSRVNIVMLDACRDNPFGRSFRSSNRGLAVMQAAKGSYIAYATSPGSVAADGKGRNSPFTQSILKHISTPGLTIDQVFKRVNAGVFKTTGEKQLPWQTSSLMEDFYFKQGVAMKQAVVVASPPSLSPSLLELQKSTYRLTIQTDPPDARVRILNIGPKYQPGMELKPGRYYVEVTCLGYARHTEWVEVASADLSIPVRLKEVKEAPMAQPSLDELIASQEQAKIKALSAQKRGEARNREVLEDIRKYRDLVATNPGFKAQAWRALASKYPQQASSLTIGDIFSFASKYPQHVTDPVTDRKFVVIPGGPPLQVSIQSNKSVYIDGDWLSYFVKGNKDFWAVVYCENPDGKFVHLFPNKFHVDAHITGAGDYRVPPKDANWHYPIEAPLGVESLILYASTYPIYGLTPENSTEVFIKLLGEHPDVEFSVVRHKYNSKRRPKK